MVIRNYGELKMFLEKNHRINKTTATNVEISEKDKNDFKSYYGQELIMGFDNEGNYTSYPNEELKQNKFKIRKKYYNLQVPEHRHEYMEMVYLLEGEIHMNIEGKDVIMGKNDICIMDKNVKHSNKPLNEGDLAVNILLTSELFDSTFMYLLSDNNYMSNFIINSFYSTNKSKRYILHKIQKNSFLENVLINLICEQFSNDIRCQGKINACLLLLFIELSREVEKTENLNINTKYSKVKEEIIEYLQHEYKEISLLKVAEHFHFHPNYLSNLIKKEFGKNFKFLLIDIRMGQACKLLRTTDKKISIIAEEVGYLNEGYFYRQFKKKYNMTPHEYRQLNNEN